MDGVPFDINSPLCFGHRPPPYEINGTAGEPIRVTPLQTEVAVSLDS